MAYLHSENQETISLSGLQFFVDGLAAEMGLSQGVHELLMEQVDKLGVIYGKTISRKEALKILSQQLEVTKTGRVREPVSISEFVESPEYMGQGPYVRPAIMDHLIRLFDDQDRYYEVVLGGAIGIGKNYFADMAVAYILYNMSCLYSPQAYYGLAPGSDIVFVHQSKTQILARKVVYGQFAARLGASSYFPKHFPFQKGYKAQLRFPHNISVVPISSAETAALGMNILCAVIDELNFMARVRRSSLTRFTGEEEYDQAEKLYSTILRRIESRYDLVGKAPGKIFLISSANYTGDFIDRKEKEAETNPHIFVMHLAHWDSPPLTKIYSGKKFYVILPSDRAKGLLVKKKPVSTENVVEVPIEYEDSFKKDLDASLRDVAGIAVTRHALYIDIESVQEGFQKYEVLYGKEQIFSEHTIVFENLQVLEAILNLGFLRQIKYRGPFGAHIDLALTEDSAGVGIGTVVGSKDIGSRTVYDPGKGKFVTQAHGNLPVYAMVGLLKILPPRGGEVNLNIVRDLLLLISDYVPLKWITSDRFQSAAMMQAFRSKGIASSVLSVDKNPSAYTETKHAIREQRVFYPFHPVLESEMKDLQQDARTGKIDHREGGSKDLADVVAGVVYEFSQKRFSYRKKGDPLPITKQPDKRESGRLPVVPRPSSGREALYS